MEIPNKHNVSIGVWETFTGEGKLRFNNIMDKAKKNQKAFIHPFAFEMEQYLWEALIYNIACVVAYNEFDLDYTIEPQSMFSAVERLKKLPRHPGHLGYIEDCEQV